MLFQDTVRTEKGSIIATNKETKEVIAKGIDKKEESEVVIGGKVIAVEVPDELAEAFEGFIGSLITAAEKECLEEAEEKQNAEEGTYVPVKLERTEISKLTEELADVIAQRVADQFMILMRSMRFDSIQSVVKSLEEAEPMAMVNMLKAIFLTTDMENALKALEILDICYSYQCYSYDLFQEAFLDVEGIEWFCVRNWIEEEQTEHNSKLN